jgi:hypothetical protein
LVFRTGESFYGVSEQCRLVEDRQRLVDDVDAAGGNETGIKLRVQPTSTGLCTTRTPPASPAASSSSSTTSSDAEVEVASASDGVELFSGFCRLCQGMCGANSTWHTHTQARIRPFLTLFALEKSYFFSLKTPFLHCKQMPYLQFECHFGIKNFFGSQYLHKVLLF